MFTRILVPLDGSTRAECAIPVAARIARASGGKIDLLRVVYPPIDYGMYLTQSVTLVDKEMDAAIDGATEYLAGMARTEALEGIDTKIEAIAGAVAPTVLSYTQSAEIDLVVMCSHGYSGLKRWMLGSVAEKVARHATVPVLILHENGPALTSVPGDQSMRALVALDGSSFAEAVLDPTIDLIAALSAPAHGAVHLLRVVDVPVLDGKGKSQVNIGVDVMKKAKEDAALYLMAVLSTLKTVIGAGKQLKFTASLTTNIDVAGAIVKEAQHVENTAAAGTNGYAFIAMSTHGRSGIDHWMTGSITERTLHGTRLPLLIVRPQIAGKLAKEADKDAIEMHERIELQTWSALL